MLKSIKVEHLKGALTEMNAGKSLCGPAHDRELWNNATERCISILRGYMEGEGLFQLTDKKRKRKIEVGS